MAKISPLKIGAISESDRRVSVNKTFEMKVMSDGTFWAILPKDNLDQIRRYGDLGQQMKQDRAKNWCLTGKSVDEIRSKLNPWVESLLEVDVETRTLILYRLTSDCPHTTDKAGNIYRHGGENPDYDGRPGHPCGWKGDIGRRFSTDREGFFVKITAGIWIETKTTAKGQFPSYQYSRPTNDDLGPHGRALNEWTATLFHDTHQGRATAHSYVIYSEERAKFFDEVQMTMCKLQTRMNEFFTGDGIEERIAKGNFLSIGHTPNNP